MEIETSPRGLENFDHMWLLNRIMEKETTKQKEVKTE